MEVPKEDPEFIKHREQVLADYLSKNKSEKKVESKPIKITLPDGSILDGVSNETTSLDIAKKISQGLANNAIVAKVNGTLQDLTKPLSADCKLQILKFDDPQAKYVFWHSTAHILGEALEKIYHCKLCAGPPIDEGGMFYDTMMGSRTISESDHVIIMEMVKKIIGEKQPFEQIYVPKDVCLEMFKYNPYKLHYLSEVEEGGMISMYRCGTLIDPCRGPHVPHTGRVTAFKILKNSSSYWLGKAENEVLQRIYGISFPDKKMLTEYEEQQKQAAERDHRNIGQKQELFFFHPLSPGSSFMLPHGARIYNKLITFIRSEYNNRGFTEVITPNMFNSKLWETSGHWANYKENMFTFKCDDTDFALKPMNCPGHCLMFDHRDRSYKELPIRFADFGVLHRNELSGALTGLTRVRRFQQDDAHIFCAQDQIKSELKGALNFMARVYGIFGFKFSLELSTRPEKFLGDIEVWNRAEKQLEEQLNEFKAETGSEWKLNPGDGAFYGPKIDIHIKDAIHRSHQCATIQLDFQLPIRFDLKFSNNQDKPEKPVIIHRAILGSVERFMAILIEHTAGKWPFWISPRQVVMVPVNARNLDYAKKVQQLIHDAGYFVEIDTSDNTVAKKILRAQASQTNYILTVGDQEEKDGTVNIRTRDNVQHGTKNILDMISEFNLVSSHFQ